MDQEAGVPENVTEAREWIKAWRSRSLESKLPQEDKVGASV